MNQRQSFSLEYVLLCSVLSLCLGFLLIYYVGVQNVPSSSTSTYYQDLNSVEIKVGAFPIDPKLIQAVHHFQKYPFGNKPNEDSDQRNANGRGVIKNNKKEKKNKSVYFNISMSKCESRFYCLCLIRYVVECAILFLVCVFLVVLLYFAHYCYNSHGS